MYINILYKFHRIPDTQSHFIAKVHDLLGQPSYMQLDRSGPEAIKLFSSSTQLSTKFILIINVKLPTSFGILTFY